MKLDKISLYMNQSDHRGSFLGLVNQGFWQEVNFVATKSGEIRGGHFHLKTNELIFLVRGKAEVTLQHCHNTEEKQKFILNSGEGRGLILFIRVNLREKYYKVEVGKSSYGKRQKDRNSLASRSACCRQNTFYL